MKEGAPEWTLGKEGAAEWTLESWLAAKGTELTTRQLEFASNLVPK